MKMEIKYVPKNLGEVIYPNDATERRIDGFATGKLSGHVILCGPNGTAKSTTARLLVDTLGGKNTIVDTDFDSLFAQNDLKGYMEISSQHGRLSTAGKYFQLFNEFDNAKGDMHKFWTALDACGDDLMLIITRGCPKFCVNGQMAGNCRTSRKMNHDRKQRIDRPATCWLQKA